MTVLLRLIALIGSLAHGVDRLAARLFDFLPFRLPGAVILAALLLVAAWGSAQETSRAISARPRPAEIGLAELVERTTSAWVSVSGLLSGPHLDNGIYASDRDTHFLRISNDPHDHVEEGMGEPLMEPGQRQTIFPLTQGDGVTRWFYVLRDPGGGDAALVVRSARDAEQIRTRSVRVVPAASVDGSPHLLEIGDAGAAAASVAVDEVVEEEATIRGAFGEPTEEPCDSGDSCRDGRTWRYPVTDADDPEATAWVDSPHPPDALPVTLDGVVATDASRMEIVLATREMQVALDGLRHPDDLVLADGIGPQIPEATYLGTMLFAIVAAILLVSAAIPYPVFRRAPDRLGATPPRLPRPVVGELIEVEVHGQLAGASGTERIAGAPARIGWLPARELARRAWHLRIPVSAATDERPRLAMLAVEGSFVLPIDPIREQLEIEAGLIATSRGVRPALRIVGPGVRMVLGFASDEIRARVRREIAASVAEPADGPIPDAAASHPVVRHAWARRLTATALAGTGLIVVVAAVIGLLGGGATPPGVTASVVVALGLAALAVGLVRRHPLAEELLPSVAVLGIVVAAIMALGSLGCGTWLSPNVAGCSAFDPLALLLPLAAVAVFGLSLWAVPHLSAQPAPRAAPRTGSR